MEESRRGTTDPAPTDTSAGWEEGPPPEMKDRVRELFVSLSKAVRAHQLYEENNPVYQRFVSGLRDGFRELWEEELDRLPVQVEENRILWRGEEVYGSDRRSDSLAFLFFKDGIREIVFEPGIEDAELHRFLDLLHRARNLRPESDDLLTILWEEDLETFRYHHVDVLVEDVELPTAGSGGDQEDLQQVLESEVEESTEADPGAEAAEGTDADRKASAPPPAPVSAEDFNPALYSLDRNELDQLGRELEKEMNRDLRRSVLAALFDRLEEPANRERQSKILGIFRTLLPNLLSRGVLRPAAAMLHELDALRRVEGLLDEPRLREVERLLDEMSAPETIGEVVRALEDGSIRRDSESLGALLQFLKPGAIEPLLRQAEVEEDPVVAEVLQEALRALAERHRDRIVGLLDHDAPLVLRGAARLAGQVGMQEAASALAGLLDHEAPEVRLAAVEAAAELRAATAASALERALEDPERDVRIAAARALAALGYRPAAPRFREILESRELRRADVSEMIAFFESYGRLGDPDAVPLLDGLLNGKGFLGHREPEEVRACAALALGELGSSDARRALEAARSQKAPVVRNAVSRALEAEGVDGE